MTVATFLFGYSNNLMNKFPSPPHLARACCSGALALLLAACAPVPPSAPAPDQPAVTAPTPPITPATPAATGTASADHAAALLQIDSAASLIAVTVRRGGVLARLGHDHVVAARTVTGTVSPSANRATLQFRLDEMTVDEAALRQAAGLTTQPSAEAIAGTRHNMLAKVLDAERYPLVTIEAERADADQLRVAITLHGVTRRYVVPAAVTETDGALRVDGTLALRQTDFGLTPFSVMGGAMAVQDEMELRFSLLAKQAAPSGR